MYIVFRFVYFPQRGVTIIGYRLQIVDLSIWLKSDPLIRSNTLCSDVLERIKGSDFNQIADLCPFYMAFEQENLYRVIIALTRDLGLHGPPVWYKHTEKMYKHTEKMYKHTENMV